MNGDELKKKQSILQKIVTGFIIIPEITLYQINDFFIVPIKNWLIPRSLKKAMPWLSCRRYNLLYSKDTICMPAKKYKHKVLFFFRNVCRCYDSGKCIKYKNN